MNAAQTRLQATAFNVANVNTAGGNRQEVLQSSTPGGISTSVKTVASGNGNNLATDMVQLLEAKHAYLANLTVFKAHDEAIGRLIDIRA